ncbi:hypothetical protein CN065_13905 [Sinorhizobium meliloti]|uniref:hypothetical protein n=1 Tax=Rhizobium meliloti TaxID=382 RepID=UPI000B4A3397|nr:hypothetical protein [Sinorhizobium meliloti]ASP98475.1 hypothetical protein CDO24_14160 [Sinorhizobium meliloti]MQV66222.1 hypothetical protein [Sinorhizobium meliloti]RVQ39292.1 hypothetical protein CN065_13905 [Sinorhizobium meliloti]
MIERPRKKHFSEKIAQRQLLAASLLEEVPQDGDGPQGEVGIWPRVKPIEVFWAELEQRIRDGEAVD